MNTSLDVTDGSRSAKQEPDAWDVIVKSVRDRIGRGEDADRLAAFIAEFMPALLFSPEFTRHFRVWESHGFHVTPVHFYSPIPDTSKLPDEMWDAERSMRGIQMNEEAQLALLNAWRPLADEYNQIPLDPTETPERFYLRNPMFAGMDALVLYCMVRHFAPRVVIEVGSGFSTRLFLEAARRNGPTDIVCIEPYPDQVLKHNLPVTLLERRVQDVPLSLFDGLGSGDFLFIDSSHTVKAGGDVTHLLLEVLPRLNPGVIVHVHDIHLPRELPRERVVDNLQFWCEQDLLQAFLAFNGAFTVLMANAYLGHRHGGLLRELFPRSDWVGGGSFWIQRVA